MVGLTQKKKLLSFHKQFPTGNLKKKNIENGVIISNVTNGAF